MAKTVCKILGVVFVIVGVAGFAARGFDLPVVGAETGACKAQVDMQFGPLLDQGAPPSTATLYVGSTSDTARDRAGADLITILSRTR